MIACWVEEACNSGARLGKACAELGIAPTTLARCRKSATGVDGRMGPKSPPANRLTEAERTEVLKQVNSRRFRGLSPKQIVPKLLDENGEYLASESTIYRLLAAEGQLTHRGRAKPKFNKRPNQLCAQGPGQVWSWDTTFLRSPVAGKFFYLYLFLDVWSRKIVAARVFEAECSKLAAETLREACKREAITPDALYLHADNGAAMKGSTLKATMESLGVLASYRRPSVSDDNPYPEALFRTLKYRPSYPNRPFRSLQQARDWVEAFVHWYNHEHLHSAIAMLTPADRHSGRQKRILERRKAVMAAARRRHPNRWNSRPTRAWNPPDEV